MLTIPFEAQAKAEEPMPDLSPPETYVYQSIAILAARYRLGRITAEQSRREMEIIRHNYEQCIFYHRDTKYMAEFWRDIEWALDRYGKERTIENADILHDACLGLLKRNHDTKETEP